jgi:hypothetical protein
MVEPQSSKLMTPVRSWSSPPNNLLPTPVNSVDGPAHFRCMSTARRTHTPRCEAILDFVDFSKRSLAAAALSVALVTMLSACWNSPYTITDGAPHLTASYIEGTWTKSGPNGVVAQYQFLHNGHFIATNIPRLRTPKRDVGNIDVNWSETLSGTGTWTIDKNDQDPSIIDLSYDQASTTFDPMTESGTAGNYSQLLSLDENHVKGLFLTAGDPDEQYRFVFHKLKG